MGVDKLKSHKSPGIDQIPAVMIKARVEHIALRSINLLVLFGIRRELPEEWAESINLPIYKNGDKQTAVIIEAYYFCQLGAKFYHILLSRLTPYAEEITGGNQCGFRRNRSTIDHIFYVRQILEKKMTIH